MHGRRYEWKRFWCPIGQDYALFDDGFLPDPDTFNGQIINPHVVPFDRATTKPFVAMLGLPGIGKSTAMSDERSALAASLSSTGDALLDFDLRDCPSVERLEAMTFAHPTFRSWLAGTHLLHLYLDSLDEGMLQVRTLARHIGVGLKSVPAKALSRLRVRVGCRSAEWPASLQEAGVRAFGADEVGLYRLVQLRRRDVEAAARARGLDAAAFVAAVVGRGVAPLAAVPVTLNMLLDLFARHDGVLPAGRAELYRQACRLMCAETSDSRIEAGYISDADRRLAVAMRLAAVTVFCNRAGVDDGPDPLNAAEGDIPAAELAGGAEPVLGNAVEVTEVVVRDALAGGLFERRGSRRRAFGHRTYAEFLAAAYVATRAMPLAQVRGLIFGPDGRVIPQLRETAAWLSGLIPGLLDAVLEADPRVLLESDVVLTDPRNRERVVASLLAQFDRGEGGDYDGTMRKLLTGLAHPGLAGQLAPYLADRSKGIDARMTAIDIARECKLHDTAEQLAGVAQDAAEYPSLRQRAARAYAVLHPKDELDKLGGLVALPPAEDPDDDMRAVALATRWPTRMTAAELFAALHPPRRHVIGSRYWTFLRSPFAESLTRGDMAAALVWARDQETLREPGRELTHAVAAVMERAWRDAPGDPALLDAFAEAAIAILARHEPLARPKRDGDLERLIAADDSGRFPLLERVVARVAATGVSPARLVHGQTPLVFAEDIRWLLDQAAAASGSPAEQAVWVQLVGFVFSAHDPNALERIGLIAEVARTVPALRDRFSYYLDGVPLDSDIARQEREIHLDEQERKRREAESRRPVDPPADRRVADALARVEAGDPAAWVQLAHELELGFDESAGHEVYFESPDLTTAPGWTLASPATRERIVAAARGFLEFDHPDAGAWLEGAEVTRGLSDGYRAIRLLNTVAPGELTTWPATRWRRWAASLVRSTGGGDEAAAEDRRRIVRLAYERIPDDLVHRLLARIDREAAAGHFTHPDDRFADCWDVRLRSALEAKAREVAHPGTFAGLLKDLLAHGSTAARTEAEALLRPPLPLEGPGRARALAAAVVFVESEPDAGWSSVWPAIQSDSEFGKALFEQVAGRMGGTEADLGARLAEADAGALFVWLSHQFPHGPDDEGAVGEAMVSRETVAHFRDAIMGSLRDRGTLAALEAIRQAIAALPHVRWLGPTLVLAQEQARRKLWQPPKPDAVLALAANADRRIVASAAQLRDVVVESLARLQDDLVDAGTMIFVWDNVKDQSSKATGATTSAIKGRGKRCRGATAVPSPGAKADTSGSSAAAERTAGEAYIAGPRPSDEAKLRLLVKEHLDRDLRQRGVLLNQEVEIRPGEFLDIYVSTALPGAPSGRAAVVIEVKGCWNDGLQTSMETQLRDRYLAGVSSRHGIYLVGWFLCDRWDRGDYRYSKTPKWTLAEARATFDAEAARLSGSGVSLLAVTLDLALR